MASLAGAIVVGCTSAVALKNDWPSKGLDNAVVKVMLTLLTIGCIMVCLGSLHVLGG